MTANRRRSNGFTLVEILIVVVILGILAALVVPQFTRATNESTKATLARLLQSVNHQIELYRVQHSGGFPTNDLDSPLSEGGANFGWGVLVSARYMKEAPRNPYTGSSVIMPGDEATAIGTASSQSDRGWYFEETPERLDIYAAGYDRTNDLLQHEQP